MMRFRISENASFVLLGILSVTSIGAVLCMSSVKASNKEAWEERRQLLDGLGLGGSPRRKEE